MALIVPSLYLNLATEVIVSALHYMQFTGFPVLIKLLPLNLSSASVFAINDLKEASFVMERQILINDHSRAFEVRALDLPIIASNFMWLYFLPL